MVQGAAVTIVPLGTKMSLIVTSSVVARSNLQNIYLLQETLRIYNTSYF